MLRVIWVYNPWYFNVFTNFIQTNYTFCVLQFGLLCCTRWFESFSLWMKSESATIQGGSNFWVGGLNPTVWPFIHSFISQRVYKVVLTFEVCGWNHKGWPFKWKIQSRSFLWHRLLFVYERSIVAIQLKTTDPLYPSQAIFYVSIHNCFTCESKITNYTRFV